MKQPTQPDDPDQQYAEQLAQLSPDVQAKALALIRGPADDPKVPKRDRDAARRRAEALKRKLARLKRGPKKT